MPYMHCIKLNSKVYVMLHYAVWCSIIHYICTLLENDKTVCIYYICIYI